MPPCPKLTETPLCAAFPLCCSHHVHFDVMTLAQKGIKSHFCRRGGNTLDYALNSNWRRTLSCGFLLLLTKSGRCLCHVASSLLSFPKTTPLNTCLGIDALYKYIHGKMGRRYLYPLLYHKNGKTSTVCACLPSSTQNRTPTIPCRPACLLSLGFQKAVSPLESVCAALLTKTTDTSLMWFPLLSKNSSSAVMCRSLNPRRL